MIDQKEFERWMDSPEGVHAECEIRRWHGTNAVTSNQLWDWYTKVYLPVKQKEERRRTFPSQFSGETFSRPQPVSEKRADNCIIREWKIQNFLNQ